MRKQVLPAAKFLRLWFSRVSAATVEVENSLHPLLSASEVKRLGAIGSKTRRREYLLSRALMRHALSQTFQRQDDGWQFDDLPESMPVVRNLPSDTFISLSHSKGFICFAISASHLGIDLEATDKQRDFTALAEVFMNAEEQACLLRNPPPSEDYFYRVWSAKEACYKKLSSARQSKTSLQDIRYSELIENASPGYLFEGRIDGFVLAAMMADKPQEISCNYYLMSEKQLQGVDLRGVEA